MTYELQTRAERRARLKIGEVTFRAKEVGIQGNLLSITAFEYAPKKARIIVTNHKTSSDNVIGPVIVNLLDQQLDWNESATITPTAHGYSISLQIADGVTEQEFRYSQLFRIPSKLSVKLAQKPSEFAPDSIVRIVPRCQVIELVWNEGTLPDMGGYQVPTEFEWIELDGEYVPMFQDTYLRGGDGLPESPAGFYVSPTTAMVVLNVTEDVNGKLVDVNKVFQWQDGWKPY